MAESSPIFVGIDLAIAKKKFLPVVICQWWGTRCVPLPLRRIGIQPPRGPGNLAVLSSAAIEEFAEAVSDYLVSLSNHLGLPIAQIAIDAPKAAALVNGGRREAERAMDREGISCFSTPNASQIGQILTKVRAHVASGRSVNRLPHANQLWMIFGFEMFRVLSNIAPCIEVYPQLTVRLLGLGQKHKSQPGAVQDQLNGASRLTGWPTGDVAEPLLSDIGYGAAHDLLDAYLAAWVAALPSSKRVAYGRPPEDVIWAPQVSGHLAPVKPTQTKKVVVIQAGGAVSGDSHWLLCPACRKHNFKRWPLGWDAHAAYKCEGITGGSPQARKDNFRRQYSEYFAN
jgi:hypothetical protein